MKKIILSFTLSVLIMVATAQRLIFLVDVSDERLFDIIRTDLTSNLGTFLATQGFGQKIKEGQVFTMSWGSIGSRGDLELQSASIIGPSPKLARQQQRKMLDLGPLIQLKNSELKAFEAKAKSKLTNTSIATVVLKAISQCDSELENYLFVLSDLVENNEKFNFYKKVPDKKEVAKFFSSIDPLLVDRVKSKSLANIHLVLVKKVIPETKSTVDEVKLLAFWHMFFSQLGISSVQVIDNLTNAIEN